MNTGGLSGVRMARFSHVSKISLPETIADAPSLAQLLHSCGDHLLHGGVTHMLRGDRIHGNS